MKVSQENASSIENIFVLFENDVKHTTKRGFVRFKKA